MTYENFSAEQLTDIVERLQQDQIILHGKKIVLKNGQKAIIVPEFIPKSTYDNSVTPYLYYYYKDSDVEEIYDEVYRIREKELTINAINEQFHTEPSEIGTLSYDASSLAHFPDYGEVSRENPKWYTYSGWPKNKHLIYGPYVTLSRGSWHFAWDIEIYCECALMNTGAKVLQVDICKNVGKTIIMTGFITAEMMCESDHGRLGNPFRGGIGFPDDLRLEEDTPNIECRLYLHPRCYDITAKKLRIQKMA